MREDFKWTSNDVYDFVMKVFNKSVHADIYEYEQSKQNSNEDWEIVSIYSTWEHKNWGKVNYSQKEIKSVRIIRRMKDEMFTVGDKTQFGTIKSFYICQDKDSVDYGCMMVCFEEVRANRNLMEVEKEKQKLFTTLDGKDICEGDMYCIIELPSYNLSKSIGMKGAIKRPQELYFSTEAAAKDYIVLNKPCLSLSDVDSCVSKAHTGTHYEWKFLDEQKLKKLVNEKINDSKR